MADRALRQKPPGAFARWFLEGSVAEAEGPYEGPRQHAQHPWWQVMCLTGVDYFSTLGYQPGIAALAAGALSPIATLVLVLVTLLGALPIYHRVAEESPNGEGSISMLERLLSWWTGKLLVLVLLGFVATDFIITITLSAADATAHVIENPLVPHFLHGHNVAITLVLLAVLAGVFLRGFREAIGIAVILVAAYLALNAVVVGAALLHVAHHPAAVSAWRHSLFVSHGSPMMMIAVSLLLFPRLALGLSGFETGVAVMPLVRGAPTDTPDRPIGRIRSTRKLLLTAALLMSVFLILTSFVTTLLIPAAAFRDATDTVPAGPANGRALAYLAHALLGSAFGTVYDISTILILWFAGASAMAGLLNIVPRYLPRYGMAPDWTRAVRPLVLVYAMIAAVVTVIFRADVTAQGGAYATGVLVLITSAAIATALSARRAGRRWQAAGFLVITLVFVYTTAANVVERPDGIKIASFFIAAIVVTSLVSRIWRSLELRTTDVVLDPLAQQFLDEVRHGPIHILANRCRTGKLEEYRRKERLQREDNRIPPDEPLLFLEVEISDASEFTGTLNVRGVKVGPYRVFRTRSPVVPNAIAAFLLHIRDVTGDCPHAYFHWSEGNPVAYLFRYLFFGEGDTAPVTHEVLRRAEPDHHRRPAVHVGG